MLLYKTCVLQTQTLYHKFDPQFVRICLVIIKLLSKRMAHDRDERADVVVVVVVATITPPTKEGNFHVERARRHTRTLCT